MLNAWKWKSLSCVWFFATPWTIACQAPLSTEFPRQEYWNGLPFPPPMDLLNPGTEPGSLALQADSLLSEPLGKPQHPQKTRYSQVKEARFESRSFWFQEPSFHCPEFYSISAERRNMLFRGTTEKILRSFDVLEGSVHHKVGWRRSHLSWKQSQICWHPSWYLALDLLSDPGS